MTPQDIPAAAHLLVHAFGENGMLNRPLGNPSNLAVFNTPLLFESFSSFLSFYLSTSLTSPSNISQNINNWIARLRITLCDHCSFVVEDMEFTGDPGL